MERTNLTIHDLRPRNFLLPVALVVIWSTFSSATTLSGTATNGTTGKPSAGDQVILIKLSAGMEEVDHKKTDSQGKFSFQLEDGKSPYLIRAVHEGVTYHAAAPPGTTTVELKVYDVAPKLDGINVVADLLYVQASQGKVGITRVFAVDNSSQPPRTQMNDASFEFYLPASAEIDEAQAQTSGGQPLNVSPTPQADKGRYAFDFPLRPGQTQFQVTYHLNYSGKMTIDPHLIYPLEHLVVIIPKSIAFTPAQAGIYQMQASPKQPDAMAAIASNARPGQKLSFDISGEGMLQGQDQEASAGGGTGEARPGGGLGTPIDAPDPLDKYRGYILAAFGVVLVGGAVFIVIRARSVKLSGATPAGADSSAARSLATVSLTAASSQATMAGSPLTSGVSHSSMFFEGLKEELFQLELEHKQGKISDEDYLKTKAALDQTLARVIKRSS
jgi:hypothetical protein